MSNEPSNHTARVVLDYKVVIDPFSGTTIHYVQRAEHRAYGELELAREAPPTLDGYNEIYQLHGLWFAYHESDGGSFRSVGYHTSAEAERVLHEKALRARQFWDEKVGWLRNGDRTPPSRRSRPLGDRVIRAEGIHYTIGNEPTEIELSRFSYCLGHGGARFRFQSLATGEVIASQNVWYQGRIPVEYRDLLPDNATRIAPDRRGAW